MHRELQTNGRLEGHAYVLDPAGEDRSLLLLFGERDPIVVSAERERLTELFSAAGALVSRKVWPGVGHALIQEDVLAAREWLKTL